MQTSASIKGASSSSPLVPRSPRRQCSSIARSRTSGAVSVRARAFDAVPKTDKFVPKRGLGAGDLRKLGSSDLMVSCECSFGGEKRKKEENERSQIDVAERKKNSTSFFGHPPSLSFLSRENTRVDSHSWILLLLLVSHHH